MWLIGIAVGRVESREKVKSLFFSRVILGEHEHELGEFQDGMSY